MNSTQKLLAEAIGTFFLCFAGIAAILNTQDPIAQNSGAQLLGIALAHGLALSIAVNAFGGVSGGHFNPAVTVGFLANGRIKPPETAMYIGAQIVGAVVAAGACAYIFPAAVVDAAKLGIPLPGEWVGDNVMIVLVTEFILSFLLMTAIYGTAVDERGKAVKIGGFGIGLTVTFDILAGGPVTGASMNPARSLGPALVHGHFDWHWCYWVAPIAGTVVAAIVYENLILADEDKGA